MEEDKVGGGENVGFIDDRWAPQNIVANGVKMISIPSLSTSTINQTLPLPYDHFLG
jgi:hypothetical protein